MTEVKPGKIEDVDQIIKIPARKFTESSIIGIEAKKWQFAMRNYQGCPRLDLLRFSRLALVDLNSPKYMSA